MKIIINNKLYDTDKAKLLFTYQQKVCHSGLFCDMYPYHKVRVYKTDKGTYFKYIGEPAESGWEDDKREILLLTEEDVKSLLIELNLIDKYIEVFGEVKEG